MRATLLLCLLAGALCVSASRELLADDFVVPTTVADCKKNTFFPVPTAWIHGEPYLVMYKGDSADKYCQYKGFDRSGKKNAVTQGAALLTETVLNVKTLKTCTGPNCMFLSGVECIPVGGKRCTPDGADNYGVGNLGAANMGHDNEGLANIGNKNHGYANYGNRNEGDRNIGCDNKGQQNLGWGLEGAGNLDVNMMDVFATCLDSELVVPVP